MKYFIDFEFLEGGIPAKMLGTNIPKWLIKPNDTIQPISIGIVSQDDREYYAISKEFNLNEAWNRDQSYSVDGSNLMASMRKNYWLRDNILKPIWLELSKKYLDDYLQLEEHYKFSLSSLRSLLDKYGKTTKEIAQEVEFFIRKGNHVNCSTDKLQDDTTKEDVAFYGYYCDYDWVVFCWLFGKMIDLPKGFPMYCRDLKQELDYILEHNTNTLCDKHIYKNNIKHHPKYPKQINEHNALADARWNKQLYDFLTL